MVQASWSYSKIFRKRLQWVETSPFYIHIFPTDICYLTSWYYANAFADVKY
jgi:hypothetical protein